MISLEQLRSRLSNENELVTIGHPMIPHEVAKPFTQAPHFDMDSAIQAVADGALAGIAYDRIRQTETSHVFAMGGRMVYVDYGISDRAATQHEFAERLKRGVQIVDAQADGLAITYPTME